MFNEEETELYGDLIEQIKMGLKISLSGMHELLSDEEFEKSFKGITGQIAKYSKTIYESLMSEGFTRDEAITLTAAFITKSSGK
jgi:hypothetical protein